MPRKIVPKPILPCTGCGNPAGSLCRGRPMRFKGLCAKCEGQRKVAGPTPPCAHCGTVAGNLHRTSGKPRRIRGYCLVCYNRISKAGQLRPIAVAPCQVCGTRGGAARKPGWRPQRTHGLCRKCQDAERGANRHPQAQEQQPKYLPTPAEIEAWCRHFREENPREPVQPVFVRQGRLHWFRNHASTTPYS